MFPLTPPSPTGGEGDKRFILERMVLALTQISMLPFAQSLFLSGMIQEKVKNKHHNILILLNNKFYIHFDKKFTFLLKF